MQKKSINQILISSIIIVTSNLYGTPS